MRKFNVKKLKENFINFLSEAARNRSQCKYVAFNYLQGTIFGIVLWKYIIFELCFGIDPIWFLYFVVILFGNSRLRTEGTSWGSNLINSRRWLLLVYQCSLCCSSILDRVSRQNRNKSVEGMGSHCAYNRWRKKEKNQPQRWKNKISPMQALSKISNRMLKKSSGYFNARPN